MLNSVYKSVRDMIVLLTVFITPEENCCNKLLLDVLDIRVEGRRDLLKEAAKDGEPIDVADERLESSPPKEEMEQVEGRRLDALDPGVRSIGTLRLVLETAAPYRWKS